MNSKYQNELAELLSAYVDGELTSAETARVDAWLREDESARRLLDELRQTTGLISSLPRRTAPASIENDLHRRLERLELLGDAPESAPPGPSRWSFVRATLSMAAVLGAVVAAGLYIAHDQTALQQTPTAERIASARHEAEPGVSDRVNDGLSTTLARRTRTRDATQGPTRSISAARSATVNQNNDLDTTKGKDRVVEPESVLADAATKSAVSDAVHADATPVGKIESRDTDRLLMQPSSADPDRPGRDALVLSVSVGSEREGRELLRALSARFEPEAAEIDDRPSRAQVDARENAATHADNTATEPSHRPRRDIKPQIDATSRQLTLRIPVSSLPRVVQSIDDDPTLGDVTLQAGPVKVQGRERVRTMADVIASTSEQPDHKESPTRLAGRQSSFESTLRDLLAVMGIDPAAADSLASPTSESKSPEETPVDSMNQAPEGPARPEHLAVGSAASDQSASAASTSGDGPDRPAPELALTERDEAERRADQAEVEGQPSEAKEKSSLVSRRVRALERESVEDNASGKNEPASAESQEPPTDVSNRPLGLAKRPTEKDMDRPSERPTASTSEADSEEMITIVVRIEVDPSLRRTGRPTIASPADGSPPSKQPEADPPPNPKPATKPNAPKPDDTSPKTEKPDLDSYKQ